MLFFPFIPSHPLLFCPTLKNPFSVAKSCGLASAVSSPPSGSERSPAAKHIKCVLLCIIVFSGCAKQSLLINPLKLGDKHTTSPYFKKYRGRSPVHPRIDAHECPVTS